MGKRKSSSKPQGPKKREVLATAFQCLFCNHENSVTVKLDKKSSTGELNCKVCGQSYQTGINYLSQAVDVYSDWIDACDAVAKEAADGATRPARPQNREVDTAARKQQTGQGREDRYDGGDGSVEEDDADAEAEYADE